MTRVELEGKYLAVRAELRREREIRARLDAVKAEMARRADRRLEIATKTLRAIAAGAGTGDGGPIDLWLRTMSSVNAARHALELISTGRRPPARSAS